MKYTDLTNISKSRNKDGSKVWKFDNITSHRKLIDEYFKFKVIWDTG